MKTSVYFLFFILLSACTSVEKFSEKLEEANTSTNPEDTSDTGGTGDIGNPGDSGDFDYGNYSQVYYVRDGASGTNSGLDWTNAFSELPLDLQAASLYFIADGNYSTYTFDDTHSSSNTVAIVKATVSNHGIELGWFNTYGDGQAVFAPIAFSGSNYIFDGIYKYGFKVLGVYNVNNNRTINIVGSAVNIHIKNVDVDGNFTMNNGTHVNGSCNGIDVNGTDVVIEACDIHNIADDGIGVYGNGFTFLNSKLHNLHGCGTDGGCGPCYNGHSDGLELQSTSDVLIYGNMIYDIKSTSALITGQWSTGNYTRNLTMINNIFYTPETGLTVYLYYVQKARVYNNVIWGRTQGDRYGGLSIGPEMTDLDLQNNIILNINFSHLSASYNPSEHHIDNNIFAMLNTGELAVVGNNRITDPLFFGIPVSSNIVDHITTGLEANDFYLQANSPAIDTGVDLSGIVDLDFFGNPRPFNGNNNGSAEFDVGPFEYGSVK